MSDVKFNPDTLATLASVLAAPDTPDNKLDMVFCRGASITESTSHLVSEGQFNNNEQGTRDLGSSDITVVEEGKRKLEVIAPKAGTSEPETDKLKEGVSEAEASVAVIAGSDADNEASLVEAIAFYDKTIDAKTKKMSTNRHDRVYSRIFAAVSAILTLASIGILIAAWTVLSVGLLITLILIATVSFMLLSLSALDSVAKTGQIKSSAEQVLVARILKEIYNNPSIESEIDYNDEEFQKTHHFINEFLEGSIPAGYIESKELLDTLGNGKATKKDLEICIYRTLSNFILLGDLYEVSEENFKGGQFCKHLLLLLDNPSLKEELVLALDPKNITMQPIKTSEDSI